MLLATGRERDIYVCTGEGGARTVNRLINTIAFPLAVRDPAQTRTREQTNTTGNHTRLVADNVAKEVTRDNDTIQRGGVLDHNHGRRVNELMFHLEVRKLLFKRLRHDFAPEAARRQHIGLVERPHLGVAASPGQEPREPGHALHLGARVGLLVPRVPAAVVLVALAKVDAARELADNDKVGAAAHGRLERRGVDEGVRGKEAGAQVAVGAHLLAQAEEPLLGADGAGAPFGTADGAEEDGVGGLGGGEGVVGEGGAVGVDGALLITMYQYDGINNRKEKKNAKQGHGFADASGNERESAYPAEKMLVEVKLARLGSVLFDSLEDLFSFVNQ